MEFSWIDFSKTDRKKALSVIEDMWKEPGAVDELGIGVIRDYFANILFPGTSTRHSLAKYWVLSAYIFKSLETKVRQGRIRNYSEFIKQRDKEEKICSDMLIKDDSNNVGIIGKRNGNRWVKVGPSEIYWSSLRNYEIFTIKNCTINKYINKIIQEQNEDENKITYNRNESSDPEDLNNDKDAISRKNYKSYWNVPKEGYEKWKENKEEIVTVKLTEEEANFLKERIISTQRNSLFAECLRDEKKMKEFINIEGRGPREIFESFNCVVEHWNLPEETRRQYELAKNISDFIYSAQLRFNYLMAEDSFKEEWNNRWNEYMQNTLPNIKWFYIDELLNLPVVKYNPVLNRNLNILLNILKNGNNKKSSSICQKIEDLVTKWEIEKKDDRRKIGVDVREDDNWHGVDKLNYRIANAQKLATEIWEATH